MPQSRSSLCRPLASITIATTHLSLCVPSLSLLMNKLFVQFVVEHTDTQHIHIRLDFVILICDQLNDELITLSFSVFFLSLNFKCLLSFDILFVTWFVGYFQTFFHLLVLCLVKSRPVVLWVATAELSIQESIKLNYEILNERERNPRKQFIGCHDNTNKRARRATWSIYSLEKRVKAFWFGQQVVKKTDNTHLTIDNDIDKTSNHGNGR